MIGNVSYCQSDAKRRGDDGSFYKVLCEFRYIYI